MTKKILNTHLQPQQHSNYAPYAHRAIFRMPSMLREPQSVYAFSHLPIVSWFYWEKYLTYHDNFAWKTLVKPDDWNMKHLSEFSPFEYYWPPTFETTENFAMQVYKFLPEAGREWSWTLVHGTKGHKTDQLRLHWAHENKIVQLSNNRVLPDPQLIR